ncbi:J domain-containing protein [Kiloniella laminariae]|uniref:J domain-containing protein n=1 Tax=Kiloniella laminariae TaxID=454162 RepID=UPI0003760C32|nr:DnaJ domain-containing protein [Kiloniella laminariae]
MNKPFHDYRFATSWDSAKRQRCCDAPDCHESGDYRAPRSRLDLNSYYWFCLDHVRAYNAGWDYCKDMDITAVDNIRKADAVWGKPSWPMSGKNIRGYSEKLDDLGKAWQKFYGGPAAENSCTTRAVPEAERKALLDLGLTSLLPWAMIKKRYLELAKQLHPDTNGGKKGAEERLKKVNQAYGFLKNSQFVKETLQETDLTS